MSTARNVLYDKRVPAGIAFSILTLVVLVATLVCFALAFAQLSILLAGLGVVCLGLTVLGGYESYTLLTGLAPPITWVARRSEHRSPLAWIAVVFCVQTFAGLLAGHFFWSTCVQAPFGP